MKRSTGYVATIVTQDHGVAGFWIALARRVGSRMQHTGTPPPPAAACAQIMVIDLEMRGWDGLHYVQKLRQATGSTELPWIIALKAEVTAEDVDAAMAAGCNDLLAHEAPQADMMAALESADRALHDHGNQATG